jgi:ABC-type transport system involved in multi-copper enzyme maturation permease subunit
MNWLLWREYRLNRWILAAGAVLILVPYVIAAIFESDQYEFFFFGVWIFSSGSAYLTISLLAGNALAGERADRSAEFVAYLPLQRGRVLASKLILALITFVVIWGVSLWGFDQVRVPAEMAHNIDPRAQVINMLVVYCMGWLFTSFASSVTYASVSGFVAGMFLAASCQWGAIYWTYGKFVSPLLDRDVHELATSRGAMICLPVAACCFATGTWNYLRRAEPYQWSTA